jgi:hypothetical protein
MDRYDLLDSIELTTEKVALTADRLDAFLATKKVLQTIQPGSYSVYCRYLEEPLRGPIVFEKGNPQPSLWVEGFLQYRAYDGQALFEWSFLKLKDKNWQQDYSPDLYLLPDSNILILSDTRKLQHSILDTYLPHPERALIFDPETGERIPPF